jgi:hypothetical protein
MIAIHTGTRYRYPIRRLGGNDSFDQLSERKKTLLADEGVNISNDRKFAFMKLIFSKLDPNFIESIL